MESLALFILGCCIGYFLHTAYKKLNKKKKAITVVTGPGMGWRILSLKSPEEINKDFKTNNTGI